MFYRILLLDFIKQINIMRKPEMNIEKRKAAHKRGSKRGLRLKKTQAEKGSRKAKLQADKKEKARKYQEMINKVLQARNSK